jgi:hypothetical protein
LRVKLTNTQQRVYDILKESGEYCTNEYDAVRFYSDHRHAGNKYMGRVLKELYHMGLCKTRPVMINGKKKNYSEYKACPKIAYKPPSEDKINLPSYYPNKDKTPNYRQRVICGCVCGKSWWLVDEKCNKCGEKIKNDTKTLTY